MTEKKEFPVDDLEPNTIESVRFIQPDWTGLADREYKHTEPDGNTIEGNKTDDDGYIQEKNFTAGGRQITLTSIERDDSDEPPDEDNPGPLPALDLRNTPDGKGPLKRGDSRSDFVEQLQKMLKALGYDLGTTGESGDGVDGRFGPKTDKGVRNFQTGHKDWDGSQLVVDGLVGPHTSDALNRLLVGKWYDKYETPVELTKETKLITMTEKIAEEEGTSL